MAHSECYMNCNEGGADIARTVRLRASALKTWVWHDVC